MSGEELLKIMQKRRSVRSYSGEAVPMEKLNLILQAGMMAPSQNGRLRENARRRRSRDRSSG